MSKSTRTLNNKGMSLMEVMLAMAVVGVMMMALAGAFNQSISSGGYTKNLVYAMDDAKKIIEQARYVAETTGLTGTNSVTDSNYWTNAGNTGWLQTAAFAALPSAERLIEYPDGTSGNPVRVKITVKWREGRGAGSLRQYSLETLVTHRGV